MSIGAVVESFVFYLMWFPLRRIIQLLPLGVCYRLAAFGGYCSYFLSPGKRKMVANELALILNQRDKGQINKITRRSFDIYIKRQYENLLMGKLNKKLTQRMVSVEGAEHLDRVLSRGKGAIILLSHFGSYLMILPALGFMGYRINQIARPPVQNLRESIHRIVEREYSSLPVTFLRSDKSLKSGIYALKKNELVAIAFDGRMGQHWVPVNIFGLKAMVSPGPVKIAMKTGAGIIPTFIVRQKDNTQRLIMEPPFELEQMKNEKEAISVNTQKLAEIFERYVKEFPCHYGMLLQRMRERARKGTVSLHLLPEDSRLQHKESG